MEKFVLRCKIIYIFFLNIEKCTTMKQKKTEKLTVHICISLRFTQWIRLRRQWQSAVKMFNISALCLEFEWFRDNSSLPHTHTIEMVEKHTKAEFIFLSPSLFYPQKCCYFQFQFTIFCYSDNSTCMHVMKSFGLIACTGIRILATHDNRWLKSVRGPVIFQMYISISSQI